MEKNKLYTDENERPAGLRKFRAEWSAAAKDPEKKRDKKFRFKKASK